MIWNQCSKRLSIARALALFLQILDGYDGTCYTFLIKGCVKALLFRIMERQSGHGNSFWCATACSPAS